MAAAHLVSTARHTATQRRRAGDQPLEEPAWLGHRYEKTAVFFRAGLHMAAIFMWTDR